MLTGTCPKVRFETLRLIWLCCRSYSDSWLRCDVRTGGCFHIRFSLCSNSDNITVRNLWITTSEKAPPCGPCKDSDQTAHSQVWSESSLGVFWKAMDATPLHPDNEDSNQTALTLRKHAYSNILKILPWQKILIFFQISAQNIDCGHSLEPPRRGGSNEYPQSMFLSKNKKNNVYPCKPQFYDIKVGFKGVKII